MPARRPIKPIYIRQFLLLLDAVKEDWVRRGGESLGKPTHYEARDGRY